MYRKKERECEKLDEAFLFFSHYAIPPMTTFFSYLVSPTDIFNIVCLSTYFPHVFSRTY